MNRHPIADKLRPATSKLRGQSLANLIDALEPRTYLSVSFPQGFGLPGLRANDVAVADLNGDAKPDIVAVGKDTSTGTAAQVAVFANQGGGQFASPISLTYPGSSTDIAGVVVGDFNGDGVPDIAVLDRGDASVIVYLGAGTNINGTNPSFLSPVTTAFGSPGDSVGGNLKFSAGHFGGSSADLVVWDQNRGGILVLPSTGGGHFGTAIPVVNSQLNLSLQNISTFAVADFTGDGISDIAYGVGSQVDVQFGTAGGSFLTTASSYGVPNNLIEQIAAGALTSSGKPDLVVFNDTLGGASDVSVLINSGAGSFATAVNYPVADGIYETLGDFDGNGSLDIAVPNPGSGVQVLLNSGTGTFAAAASVSLQASDPVNLVAADLNGDARVDLVVPDVIGLGAGTTNDAGVFLEGASSTGGGTSSSLAGTLSGSVPPAVVAGQKVRISQSLSITNNATTTVTGSVTAALYLSSNGTVDANSIKLASTTKKEKLKPNGRVKFNFKVPAIPSTVPVGLYHLIGQVTDPSGNRSEAESNGAITVAPPQIDLSGLFAKQPIAGKNGKTVLTFTVGNAGNITASGTLAFNIESSPDGLLDDATVLSTPSKKINIKAFKSVRITQVVTLPAGSYFVVVDLDPNNAFHDVNLSNNVFASSSSLTVT